MSRTFERFTDRARHVCVLAQEEAKALAHNYIGTEHILLGLLREEEGVGARVLENLDITAERVRELVIRIVGEGKEAVSGQIPYTPRAKKILELSLREALSLGHNYIGTEHILLGLIRENEGVASRILLDFGLDSEKIRNEVIRLLSGPAAARAFGWAFLPTTENLLPGLQSAASAVGQRGSAKIRGGATLTGVIKNIGLQWIILDDEGIEHRLPLDRLESLTLC